MNNAIKGLSQRVCPPGAMSIFMHTYERPMWGVRLFGLTYRSRSNYTTTQVVRSYTAPPRYIQSLMQVATQIRTPCNYPIENRSVTIIKKRTLEHETFLRRLPQTCWSEAVLSCARRPYEINGGNETVCHGHPLPGRPRGRQ